MSLKSLVQAAFLFFLLAIMVSFAQYSTAYGGDDELPVACLNGTGPDWHSLGKEDFVAVNGEPDTWHFTGGLIKTTGKPKGVMRTKQAFTNFELVVEWRFLESGGNSGMFVWVPPKALEDLEPGKLPDYGIEIQMLDPGFRKKYQKRTGNEGNWFTTQGDVFAVGQSELTPFKPRSPDGSRSFPTKELTKKAGNWNHYYVRMVNGEARLWVNGEEVSGGHEAKPRSGHLCLESEGAPIEFHNLRIRELP